MKKLLPYVMIAFGASLWGLIAIFVKGLKDAGLSEMEIVTIRVTIAAIVLIVIGFFLYKGEMKCKVKHLPLFVGTGICSVVFFNYCYFLSINQLGVSLAVVLLYTSPAFVAILSFLFLKEILHGKKIIAVIGTILGCILIAGVSGSTVEITTIGILTGLGAGLGYALYSIFGKVALNYYQPFTVTLYTFITATIFLLPFSTLWNKLDVFISTKVFIYSIGLGTIPTVLAYFVYTWGLEKTESSKAAIIATIEPVVAMFIGVVIYKEVLQFQQMIGSLLVLFSVIFVNISFQRRQKTYSVKG